MSLVKLRLEALQAMAHERVKANAPNGAFGSQVGIPIRTYDVSILMFQ